MKFNTKFLHFFKNIGFMFCYSWNLARSKYLIVIIRAVVNTVQPFALLILPKFILDELAGQRRPDVTSHYIILFAGVTIFLKIASLLMDKYDSLLTIKITHSIQMFNQKKWLYMDYENLENGQVHELAGRSVEQVDPQGFIEKTVPGFFTNLFQLAGYCYIITSLHPIVIVLILSIIGINALITKKLNKINYEYKPIITKISRKYEYIYNTMFEYGIGKDVRINGASEWLKKKYDIESGEYFQALRNNENQKLPLDILALFVGLFQTIVIYGYCAFLAINGGITIGSFTVFLGAVTAFSSSFTSFIGRFSKLALLSKYVDDYKEFLTYTEHRGLDREINNKSSPTNGKYDIEFCNVSFKYPNTDKFVLKNINIRINAGERLSIVGYNGAGKTTFIKLLCRLYEPTEGKIFVGGVDVSTIPLDAYREMLAVVFQDFQVFRFTIRDNIVMNCKYDKSRLADSIEKSGLAEKINLLEKGAETVLGRIFDEEGIEFSGGEGQKLAYARAYYKNTPIVILDEPTASLDPVAEKKLYDRFNSVVGKKTACYISHRLASVKFCDSIAVFADGGLVERGTHRELMEKNGVYAEMFRKQAHYYLSETPDKTEAV